MRSLKESILDVDDNIEDQDSILGLKGVREYINNPKIKWYPNYITDFVLDECNSMAMRRKSPNDFSYFKENFGNYPGMENTALFIKRMVLEHQVRETDDSICATVGHYNPETNEGQMVLDKKYINKILPGKPKDMDYFYDNLDQSYIFYREKHNVEKYIMVDQGWDYYFFFYIPKNANKLEKEVLEMLFKRILETVK